MDLHGAVARQKKEIELEIDSQDPWPLSFLGSDTIIEFERVRERENLKSSKL